MIVAIAGGNKWMERRDKCLRGENQCQHKMLRGALCCVRGKDAIIARSHTSSVSALRNIPETHAVAAAG